MRLVVIYNGYYEDAADVDNSTPIWGKVKTELKFFKVTFKIQSVEEDSEDDD